MTSKVKSLASKPQVLENCLVLGSRTALLIVSLKSYWKTADTSRKRCEDFFVFLNWRSPEIFLKTFMFVWRTLVPVSLALSISVLGIKKVCPRRAVYLASDFFLCPWPWPRALCPRLHLWV